MDTGLCGLELCLFGGAIPEGGVAPLTVIVSFDVREQIAPSGFPGDVVGMVNQLGLQGVEPAFSTTSRLVKIAPRSSMPP